MLDSSGWQQKVANTDTHRDVNLTKHLYYIPLINSNPIRNDVAPVLSLSNFYHLKQLYHRNT